MLEAAVWYERFFAEFTNTKCIVTSTLHSLALAVVVQLQVRRMLHHSALMCTALLLPVAVATRTHYA